MFECRISAQPKQCRLFSYIALALFASVSAFAQPQELRLEFTPANTAVNFTLGDILHTVHGSFKLKQGEINYSFGSEAVHGQLVIDATSGESGNHSRDRKMHKEILESSQYPEIIFRPDHVQGAVAASGTSTVQVHGMFAIHGADHELTMPVRVEVFPDHWISDTHFSIPYVKWGIKNPSTLFLRVSESVEIDIHATGGNPFSGGPH
ncbi:MAG TPA: YceI family protein [Terriglobales bacterium]|nr:YceI family protein [Terriglobales bacterium]